MALYAIKPSTSQPPKKTLDNLTQLPKTVIAMKCPSTETIDQYVRFKLPLDRHEAFEDHIFDCDECYKEVRRRIDAWDDILEE